jgi:hypothetical protein
LRNSFERAGGLSFIQRKPAFDGPLPIKNRPPDFAAGRADTQRMPPAERAQRDAQKGGYFCGFHVFVFGIHLFLLMTVNEEIDSSLREAENPRFREITLIFNGLFREIEIRFPEVTP